MSWEAERRRMPYTRFEGVERLWSGDMGWKVEGGDVTDDTGRVETDDNFAWLRGSLPPRLLVSHGKGRPNLV